MRIQVIGPGRRGTIDDEGVGRLSISGAKGHEAKKLKVLWDELRLGNLGFWTPIMWAAQQGLKRSEKQSLNKIFDRVRDDFTNHVGDPAGDPI